MVTLLQSLLAMSVAVATASIHSSFRPSLATENFDRSVLENKIVAQEVARNSRRFQRDSFPKFEVMDTVQDSPFPPCSPNLYSSYNLLDIGAMMTRCSETIPSSMFPPSYYSASNTTKEYRPTNVSVQLSLNSLINVDDIQSQYTIDYFLRILWVDPRITFDDSAWEEINPEAKNEGLEISSLIRTSQTAYFWLPDIFIFQANGQHVVDELIKVKPNGSMYWSRHIVGLFNQANMPFHNYPVDQQNFSITLQSFAYDSKFIGLNFINNAAVDLAYDVQDPTELGLDGNKLWKFDGYSSYVNVDKFPSPTNPERTFWTGYVNMRFSRQSLGIIFRLAVPVMIFMVVVGASFWTNDDMRINIALQMLLMVSTLYIVIGKAIPFIGYLTLMDVYMITVFVVLAATILFHFLLLNLNRKKDKYPMDSFYRDLLLTTFRTIWIPLSIAMFTICFSDVSPNIFVFTVVVSFVFAIYILLKHHNVIYSFKASVLKLRMKADLVALGAVDESTGKPLVVTKSERLVLDWTQMLYDNPNYKKLLFSTMNQTEMAGNIGPHSPGSAPDGERSREYMTLADRQALPTKENVLEILPVIEEEEREDSLDSGSRGDHLRDGSVGDHLDKNGARRRTTPRSMDRMQSMNSLNSEHSNRSFLTRRQSYNDNQEHTFELRGPYTRGTTLNKEKMKGVIKGLDTQHGELDSYYTDMVEQYKMDTMASMGAVLPRVHSAQRVEEVPPSLGMRSPSFNAAAAASLSLNVSSMNVGH